MFNTQTAYELEAMIDHSSLAEVLELLSRICYEKAEHIESNWQDPQTARKWASAGTKIDKLAASVAKL